MNLAWRSPRPSSRKARRGGDDGAPPVTIVAVNNWEICPVCKAVPGEAHLEGCPDAVRCSGHFVQRVVACPCCDGSPKRGYQRILSEPEKIIAEQTALAEGVMG